MNYTTDKLKRYSKDLAPGESKRVIKMPAWSMVICTLFILFVFYGDGLAILSEFPILTDNAIFRYDDTDNISGVVVGNFKLSLPKLLFIFFNAGGVFNRIPDNNIEYAIYGRHVGTDPSQPWEDLNYIKECFPYEGRGEVYDRMSFPWHAVLGEAALKTATTNLLAKIKDKYNREHPQTQIDKVALYMLWWPWSEDGFYNFRQPENTHWQLMGED